MSGPSGPLTLLNPAGYGTASHQGRGMYQVIRAADQQRSPGATLTFEGDAHGSGVSFFLFNNQPGEGPDLHRHPYSETWIVRGGRTFHG